jgi:hypothetical protein
MERKCLCPEGCGQAFSNSFSVKRHVEKNACPMLKCKLAQDEHLRREHRINELMARQLDTRQLVEHVVCLEHKMQVVEEKLELETRETRKRLDNMEKILVAGTGTAIHRETRERLDNMDNMDNMEKMLVAGTGTAIHKQIADTINNNTTNDINVSITFGVGTSPT